MAAIDREPLENPATGTTARWGAFAQRIVDWTAARGVALRDTVVLLPYAQLLAPARAALAARTTWLPRVETTQTLARSLGPPAQHDAMQLGLDVPGDLLLARRLLAGEAWAREAWRGDARGAKPKRSTS